MREFGFEFPDGPFIGMTAQPLDDYVAPEPLLIALKATVLTISGLEVVSALFHRTNTEDISDCLGMNRTGTVGGYLV